MTRTSVISSALLSLMLLVCTLPAQAQDRAAAVQEPPGVRSCLTCHNNPDITVIRQTPHGQANVPGSPFAQGGCTECHGGSDTHIRGMQSPGVVFGAGSSRFPASPVATQNQACLNCHQSRDTAHWNGSVHQSADLGCVSCHRIHGESAPSTVAAFGTDICLTCHLDKRSQFNRRSHHPVTEGLMSCTDCHNPHGSAGRSLLASLNAAETCTGCHAEKRGPFLWEHQPVTDDCTTCHNPHGSTQTSLLSTRQPFLCQSCHSEAFHPSSLYSGTGIPPTGAAQQLVGGSCTNCHFAVHGSNHPSGSRLTR